MNELPPSVRRKLRRQTFRTSSERWNKAASHCPWSKLAKRVRKALKYRLGL
jgi:hypothetical protein